MDLSSRRFPVDSRRAALLWMFGVALRGPSFGSLRLQGGFGADFWDSWVRYRDIIG